MELVLCHATTGEALADVIFRQNKNLLETAIVT